MAQAKTASNTIIFYVEGNFRCKIRLFYGKIMMGAYRDSVSPLGRYPLPRADHHLAARSCCSSHAPAFDSSLLVAMMLRSDCPRQSSRIIVPGGRIELPWITPHDFESCASTNSAIPAPTTVYKKTNDLARPR